MARDNFAKLSRTKQARTYAAKTAVCDRAATVFQCEPIGPTDKILYPDQGQADQDNPNDQFDPRFGRRVAGPFCHAQQPSVVHAVPLM